MKYLAHKSVATQAEQIQTLYMTWVSRHLQNLDLSIYKGMKRAERVVRILNLFVALSSFFHGGLHGLERDGSLAAINYVGLMILDFTYDVVARTWLEQQHEKTAQTLADQTAFYRKLLRLDLTVFRLGLWGGLAINGGAVLLTETGLIHDGWMNFWGLVNVDVIMLVGLLLFRRVEAVKTELRLAG